MAAAGLLVAVGLAGWPPALAATACDPILDPWCDDSSTDATWFEVVVESDDPTDPTGDEDPTGDDTTWDDTSGYDDPPPAVDPADPTGTTWYDDGVPADLDDPWSTGWTDGPSSADPSVDTDREWSETGGPADAVVPPEILAMVDDAPDRGQDFDPDALPLDEAVVTGAARLVLGIDALAELGAFRRDPDPAVNEAVRSVRTLVPGDGLDPDGYRSEVMALGDDVARLVEALGRIGPVSPALLEIEAALGSTELMSSLERGDTGLLEPDDWLAAAADLALRGGRSDDRGSEDDLPAVVALAGRLGGQAPTPTATTSIPAATATTLDPDRSGGAPRSDPVGRDGDAGGVGGWLVAAVVAIALAALGGVALLLRRRSIRATRSTGDRRSEPSDGTASTGPDSGSTPASPPEPPAPTVGAARSASLEDLLDVSRRMTASLDENEVAAIELAEAERMVGAEGGLVAVWTGGDFRVPCHRPEALFDLDALGAGSLRRVIETGRSIVQVTDDEPTLVEVPMAMAAIPVVADGRVAGAILTVRVPSEPFAREELDGLEMLAPMIGSALKAAATHGSATQLADVDPLSGLHNRRRLSADLSAAADRPLTAIMIDIDHFKHFNDTNGHAAGDEAIRRVAELLTANVRPGDVVYRYGGEEFCILLGDTATTEAERVGERVRTAVEGADIPGGEHQPAGRVTVSVGVARSEPGAHDGVIEAADTTWFRPPCLAW